MITKLKTYHFQQNLMQIKFNKIMELVCKLHNLHHYWIINQDVCN